MRFDCVVEGWPPREVRVWGGVHPGFAYANRLWQEENVRLPEGVHEVWCVDEEGTVRRETIEVVHAPQVSVQAPCVPATAPAAVAHRLAAFRALPAEVLVGPAGDVATFATRGTRDAAAVLQRNRSASMTTWQLFPHEGDRVVVQTPTEHIGLRLSDADACARYVPEPVRAALAPWVQAADPARP